LYYRLYYWLVSQGRTENAAEAKNNAVNRKLKLIVLKRKNVAEPKNAVDFSLRTEFFEHSFLAISFFNCKYVIY